MFFMGPSRLIPFSCMAMCFLIIVPTGVGGATSNDNSDILFSQMLQMNNRMDKLMSVVTDLTSHVTNIDHMQELTAEKVSKVRLGFLE